MNFGDDLIIRDSNQTGATGFEGSPFTIFNLENKKTDIDEVLAALETIHIRKQRSHRRYWIAILLIGLVAGIYLAVR